MVCVNLPVRKSGTTNCGRCAQDSRARVVVLIGPEGGRTVHAVEMARAHSFTTVSLGLQLLRTDTTAVVLTGIVRYS